MSFSNVRRCCFLVVVLICQVVTQNVSTPTTTPTTTTTAAPGPDPDPRCSPPNITVRISDDEEPGCLYNRHELNITCSNWGHNELMRFTIVSWKFDNDIRLQYQYSATSEPAVCVYGRAGQFKDQFESYQTILNVTNRQGEWANAIPLIFEIVEVDDPPRIKTPADIYVIERDTQPLVWNISWSDPDGGSNSRNNYSITSSDIPEQLIIKTTMSSGNTSYFTYFFELVRVAAFDADIYENPDHGREEPKRSTENQLRSKRYVTYGKDTIKREIKKRKDHYSRVTREGNFPGPIVNFTLTISEENGLSTSYGVRVHINDVNDNEPVCTTPGTISISRDADQYVTLFNMRSICSDPDSNFRNQISDYRFSNMQGCIGAFGIDSYGSLHAVGSIPNNMSACEFDVVAMDSTYATSVHLELTYGECALSVDARGVLWNTSNPGKREYMSCPHGYTGRVYRYCNNYAIYEPAVYQCTSQAIRNISNKMNNIYYGGGSSNISLTTTLYELKNATNENLMAGDIKAVYSTLRRATSIVRDQSIDEANKTEAFFDVANNLLKENNSGTWQSIIYSEGIGAEMVIEVIDDYIRVVVSVDRDSFTKPQKFVKENLLLSVGSMSACSKGMDFPDKSTPSMPEWVINSDNKVHLQCSSAGENKHFSSAFYKNISNLIPSRTFDDGLKNDTVNSAVISFSLFPDEPTKLDPPIEVTMDVINKTQKDPKCSYWKTDLSSGKGSWATDGCKLKSYENGIVVCLCDHLTNFAILMSPADPDEISEEHMAALSAISLVGCIISMICLLITIVVYIIYWKAIKSERSTILLNLCTTLFIAYLVFLAGVNKTENKDVCTAVAVILHFVYLVVFLLMLVQGINLALTVLKPLNKQRFGWQMILAAYGTSLVIVVISMGATQLDGYGNENFCWLSVDSGLLWAFLAPVLVVIAANTVIAVIVLRAMFGTAAVKKKSDKQKLRTGIRSLCILMPVMGSTWIFGIFSVNRETVVFQYLFALFNSIQGILIFIFHCVISKKIQDAVKKSKAQLFTSETASSDAERIPMKSVDTTNTSVK